MGKQGPCCHCGVTSTPLWRNGPPEKPVLCNACGSRWRTKGSLVNYTPLHVRADDCKDHRVSRLKSVSASRNNEIKTLKRKQNADSVLVQGAATNFIRGFPKVLDEDTTNKSSSGSAISNSDSCAEFEFADRGELTGPLQASTSETTFPSGKRTCVNGLKSSSIEKLAKDLYTILREQQSSCFSGSSEECLILESETPMVSFEIGYGSVLIRDPGFIAQDEESEVSSVSIEDNCFSNKAYPHSCHSVNFSCGTEKDKSFSVNWMQQEQVKLDNSQHQHLQILGNHSSPLSSIDLNDVLNHEEFLGRLTDEEQQELTKYLPPSDAAKSLDSLRSMFDSPQFKDNLAWFQRLLAEGVFDVSSPETKTEEFKMLKKLLLFDMTKSHWMESYYQLKKCNTGTAKASISNNAQGVERFYENCAPIFSEGKASSRSIKRAMTKPSYGHEEMSCFTSRSVFELSSFGNSSTPNDQDVLLDVPSAGSYAQAELLHMSQPTRNSSISLQSQPLLPYS